MKWGKRSNSVRKTHTRCRWRNVWRKMILSVI